MENQTASNGTNGNGKDIGWREFERSNPQVKKSDVFKIALDTIHVKEGFNPRDVSKPETVAKIRAMADSYKAGRYVPPIAVALVGGVPDIVDGHCRYLAAKLANTELAEDMQIKDLVCVPFKGNDLDRLAAAFLSNEGERLTPLECSDVVKRMQAFGLQRQPIADKLGVTVGWVDRLIVVAKLPETVKSLMREGKVSLDVALKKFKEHGETGAAAAVAEAVKEAETLGDTKVTTRHVKAKTPAPKLDRTALRAALSIGRLFPKQELALEDIKDKKQYSIKVSGEALKSLMALQAKVVEVDAELAEAEKAEEAEAQKELGGEAWPFKPVGETAAEPAAETAPAEQGAAQ